ncbi:hypothetical protein B0T17DRAFT_600394 [Bombardia bombarda]|uniref:Diaminohydroxyphosphoribosylamino-pyrimidine deaminase n=1 Tax=Bombardia bombarda TaxID=252184 RepID=A0AA39WU07_9PEZI|nr:hypothetical protein B0T17DRAFT_600394 [Bombardia bombarda]
MTLETLLPLLGDPIQAPEEETFHLFSQQLPSRNLGFVDSKATTLELAVADRDLTIHQSPGILSSTRAGGTTGAVVWKITPLFAEWISSRTTSPLFAHGILSQSSLAIELGCGTSSIVGLLLAPRIAHYVLTDQAYVAKLVEQNIAENHHGTAAAPAVKGGKSRVATQKGGSNSSKHHRARHPSPRGPAKTGGDGDGGQIRFTALDWETDEVTPALTGSKAARSFDAVIACDCIYNESLVEPFVATCVDVCRLREQEAANSSSPRITAEPCVCVVAQQLRNSDVFEAWLTCFAESFRVWRVPDELLSKGLQSDSGFVVHVGVLK